MMIISRKKILLAIILVLFISFALLLIPFCNVFASTDNVFVDLEEILSNYKIREDSYNSFVSDGYSLYFIQPGGTLYIDNNKSTYDAHVVMYTHKDETPFSYTRSIYFNSTDKIDVDEYQLKPLSMDSTTLNENIDWIKFECQNSCPILAFVKNGNYNSEESVDITFTYYVPEFGVEVDETKTSYAPNTFGSVVGRVYGTNLPTYGTVKVDLYKQDLSTGSSVLIEEKVEWIGTVDSSFSYNFDCPPIEIGSYYLYARFISEREILYEATAPFELDGTIKDYEDVIVRDGDTYYVDSAYYNKVFKISRPKHYNLYNDDIWFDIQTPLSKDGGFTTTNIFGNFVYTDSFGLIDILLEDNPHPKKLNRKVDVYLNNVLIKEYDFKNFASVTGYLPSALLNRGKNTLFVVSNQKMYEEGPVYFKWLAPDGTYRFIHSSVEFFYKTKDGSNGLIVETDDFSGGSSGGGGGSGGGGAFSDDNMPNDGSSGNGYIGFTGLDTPPDRSNYTDDIFGTIGYGLDFIVYVISMPFKVLFNGLEWLISNFLTLFSWVGQLSAIIGSWFNFLPREVRSLLLGGFMCSIIAFVLKLFRK